MEQEITELPRTFMDPTTDIFSIIEAKSIIELGSTETYNMDINEALNIIIEKVFPYVIYKSFHFNRLKYIHQTTLFLYESYTTATHTRYEHSLGTFNLAIKLCLNHIIKKFVERREKNDRFSYELIFDKIICTSFLLANLVHDWGHPVFSHTIEHIDKYSAEEIRIGNNNNEYQKLLNTLKEKLNKEVNEIKKILEENMILKNICRNNDNKGTLLIINKDIPIHEIISLFFLDVLARHIINEDKNNLIINKYIDMFDEIPVGKLTDLEVLEQNKQKEILKALFSISEFLLLREYIGEGINSCLDKLSNELFNTVKEKITQLEMLLNNNKDDYIKYIKNLLQSFSSLFASSDFDIDAVDHYSRDWRAIAGFRINTLVSKYSFIPRQKQSYEDNLYSLLATPYGLMIEYLKETKNVTHSALWNSIIVYIINLLVLVLILDRVREKINDENSGILPFLLILNDNDILDFKDTDTAMLKLKISLLTNTKIEINKNNDDKYIIHVEKNGNNKSDIQIKLTVVPQKNNTLYNSICEIMKNKNKLTIFIDDHLIKFNTN